MNNASPIKKGLFQLLYSVIETGVCRVITSKSPDLLVTLKSAYIENIPEYHQVVFLSGKIQNLEDLTNALVKSGVNQFSTIKNHEQFIEQAKLYLIANKDKGITTIWALENADLVSGDMHQLLAQLLLWKCFGSSLLAIELWGHSLLLSSYNSGEISKYYQSKIYPISLNENLKLKSTSINLKLVIVFMLGLFLEHQIEPFLENFSNIYDTSEQQSINLISSIKIYKLEPKSAVTENTDKKNNKEMHNKQVVEHILEPKDPHWYFNLSPSRWLSEYNINLNYQLHTENNQYYIQYGVYRHKSSIKKFITQNSMLSDYYHLCYSSDWKMVALMTGAYQGYRQAFKSLIKIKEQDFDGTIVNSSYLKKWQCSNAVH
jgi:hypothetical protein